jgi:hypothetical protein
MGLKRASDFNQPSALIPSINLCWFHLSAVQDADNNVKMLLKVDHVLNGFLHNSDLDLYNRICCCEDSQAYSLCLRVCFGKQGICQ